MHHQRLALGLGICLLVGTSLSVLWVCVENGLPVSYGSYYLPCPEIFNMKLHYEREKPLQPMAWPTQLLTLTPWLAPVVSEGTFNPELPQHAYQAPNLTIGVTVFAVGKYTHFVQCFLESAEEFFMRGYRVHYYIFTDNPAAIPRVPLGPHRLLGTIPIQGHSHWEEISMRWMETISQHIAKRAHREVDYLFCLDVDMVFWNPWGPETLGDLVAAIHPGYYAILCQQFPYQRRRVSAAFVADSEGDFYYGGAVSRGQVARVYEFTGSCHMAILADKANGIVAAWQEESHLNHHFITNKPSKVLSPEYLWDDRKPQPPSLKLISFSTLDKDISCLRS
ncbi:globoside alpha-1,3-N-acetylgalactosaminyltransferase 1 isoform X1 [Cebus imitator]|uniref:globoside alpha-1,3-N-acetylgalactosaminyltransferase 1 isoform X1 n=2 Tax=Cebus imitator TaxID=2715852 RepID=UPI000809DAAC|nr:globoside alpha-1,3-N-acetylgalactosaminyltransferase 1 isoform X1 [Cebus imitator]